MSRPETVLPDLPDHRRRTARQARHAARARLRALAGDAEALEDADAACPPAPHDLGRRVSHRPPAPPKAGRRPGFKVWKTPFWKRRRALWAERNAAAQRLADED